MIMKDAQLVIDDFRIEEEITKIITKSVAQVKQIVPIGSTREVSVTINNEGAVFRIFEETHDNETFTRVVVTECSESLEVLFAIKAELGGRLLLDIDRERALAREPYGSFQEFISLTHYYVSELHVTSSTGQAKVRTEHGLLKELEYNPESMMWEYKKDTTPKKVVTLR